MSSYFGTTVDEIFNTMEARFRPEAAEGMNVVIAYDVTGGGGGKWKITVSGGKVKIEKTDDLSGASVKSTVDAETFVGVSVGKVDGMAAFTSGKLKVEGDMTLLAATPKLFTRFTPPKKGVTVQDIIGTLVERFRPKNAPAGREIAVAYNITGDGGGQWTAVIKDGKCSVADGLRDNPTVTQTVSAKDFVDLVLGKLDPMVAFGAGRLRLAGDMEIGTLLTKIFARFAPPKTEEEQEFIVLKRNISVGMKYSTGPVMGRFFDGLKEKKILANKCAGCGRLQVPPREVCAPCRARVTEFVELGQEGIITRLEDVYYASPDPLTGETRETPYGTIHVQLDRSYGECSLWHLLKPGDLEDTKELDRVRVVWAENRTGSIHDILYFEKIR
jgi:uncharacterized OB-fold protein/putative sterol carrier protein